MNALPFNTTAGLTGVVIAGEALALLVGVFFLSAGSNPWISVKNDTFLACDIAAGLGLVYLALARLGTGWPYALYFLLAIALLTHGYREWEYSARASNPFCANLSLFLVSKIRIAGLSASVILSARLLTMEG